MAKCLTVSEFAKVHDIQVDARMLAFFTRPIIYVDQGLVEFCGFGTRSIRNQKDMFRRLLAKHDIPFEVVLNQDYPAYYAASKWKNLLLDPKETQACGKNQTKHLVVTTQNLKRALMLLTTSRAPRIHEYFIQMEELLLSYYRYQCNFYKEKYEEQLRKWAADSAQYTRRQTVAELDRKLASRYRVGCIYFVTDGEYVKIGLTHNFTLRLAELQTANPRRLRVIQTYLTLYPAQEEAAVHRALTRFRVRGEWFKLPRFGSESFRSMYTPSDATISVPLRTDI